MADGIPTQLSQQTGIPDEIIFSWQIIEDTQAILFGKVIPPTPLNAFDLKLTIEKHSNRIMRYAMNG